MLKIESKACACQTNSSWDYFVWFLIDVNLSIFMCLWVYTSCNDEIKLISLSTILNLHGNVVKHLNHLNSFLATYFFFFFFFNHPTAFENWKKKGILCLYSFVVPQFFLHGLLMFEEPFQEHSCHLLPFLLSFIHE